MLKNYSHLIFLLAFTPLFTSCVSVDVAPGQTPECVYNTHAYLECPIDMECLEEEGEVYEKRYVNLHDDSDFKPLPGESYESYHSRLLATLSTQEAQIDALQKAISEKEISQHELNEQLVQVKAQHTDFRIALSSENPSMTSESMTQGFKRYVIQKGDTLQSIANDRYGSHTGWLSIYRFNQPFLTEGPNHIDDGEVLFLP
jgi:hypothetical protein